MPTWTRLAVALAVGLVLGLIANFPLSWAAPLIPAGVRCDVPAGTIWQGSCGSLTFGSTPLGAGSWSIAGLPLLWLQARAAVIVDGPGFSGHATLRASPWSPMRFSELQATAQLERLAALGLASELGGTAVATLESLAVRGRVISDLRGKIVVTDLAQNRQGRVLLGSYDLEFDGKRDADGGLTGQLRDRGGPLEVTGVVTLTQAPGYLLKGAVLTRPSASPELLRQIAFLGPADAAGRRQFAQEATF